MGLSSVLVDRGRVLTFEALMRQLPDGTRVPIRVEGTTQREWVYGQWFDCRIASGPSPETPDASGGRVRTADSTSLIFSLDDDDGNRVELHADTRVQVVSDELGTDVYEVTGEPALWRKKQDLVGAGEAQLVHILDFPLVDGRTTQKADAGTTPVHIASSGS